MDNGKKLLSIIAMLVIIVGSIVYYEMTKEEKNPYVLVQESIEAQANIGKSDDSYESVIQDYIKSNDLENATFAKGESVQVEDKNVHPTLVVYPMTMSSSNDKKVTVPYVAPIFVIEQDNKFTLYIDEEMHDKENDKNEMTKSFDGGMFWLQNEYGTFKYYIKHDAPIENIEGEKFKFPKYKLEIVKVYNSKKG
ncbi:hypothetical protein [Macrococcus animalis]|uniref:hypothetical protein n=1 Tax=Macrococcus animalis TaxID=3395467 RepID=UPI0039BEB5E3